MQFNPGTRFNQYEIISPLGKGGMGEVYLARDAKLERNVALKILPLEFTFKLDRLRRFEQEAKAVSALNHPNIITIHEIGATNNTHFITTEFIAGQTLRERLAKEKLSLTAALDIAIQAANALAAAHAAGIIHRDIKPENVMLRKDGIVKVLDFGLAKLTPLRNADRGMRIEEDANTLVQSPPSNPQSPIPNPQLTDPGTVMGTAHYMSPEQARGEKVDARSDIFSLGVVLYEMVAGQRPFDGVNIFEQVAAVLDQGIYFVNLQASPSSTIEFFNFATSRTTQVGIIEKAFANGFTVSPDGRWILWSQIDRSESDIMLMENFR